jgi:hypothetical protein
MEITMRSALYYPHTTPNSESLVKTALLLWDRLEFIVPSEHFRPHYRDRQIARAMELIGAPRHPDEQEKREAHARIEELVSSELPAQFYLNRRRGDEEQDSYELYPQKLLPGTWRLLERGRLLGKLLPNSDYPMTTFGGLMVMSILADCCAGTTRTRVTDRGDAYATLSNSLVDHSGEPKLKKTDVSEQLVPISLKIVDTRPMDMEYLIALREREAKESGHSIRDLRHRYVGNLETYVSRISNEKSNKSDAAIVAEEYADDMKADLEDLRKELGFARRDAIFSKEIFVTAIAASWAFGAPVPLEEVIKLGGGPATIGGLFAARNKYLSARHAIMKKHPMAYLYEAQK